MSETPLLSTASASETLAARLGQIIRAERHRQALRLADLSLLSGVAVATLSDLENGRRDTRLSSYQRVFDALGLRAEALAGPQPPAPAPEAGYDLGDAL